MKSREHVRDHFAKLLHDFREQTSADGPPSDAHVDVMRATQALAEAGYDELADYLPRRS